MTGLSKSPADESERLGAVGELELAAEVIRKIRLGYIERRDRNNGEVSSYRLGNRSDPELESAGSQDDVERWDDVQEGGDSYWAGDRSPEVESVGWQDVERWDDIEEGGDEDSSANLSAAKTEKVEGFQ